MTDRHPDAGKMVSLTFTQPHPGGRILLMLGQHQAGAVFPPCPTEGGRWRWRWWLGGWKDVATVMRFYAHAREDATLSDAVFGDVPKVKIIRGGA